MVPTQTKSREFTESKENSKQDFIKGPAPDAFVRRQYGLIDSGYQQRLKILLGRTKAKVTFDNLVIASLALIEEDRAKAREEARKQQVFADVEAALANIPDFNAGDEHNLHAAQTFFNQNPTATAQDFIRDIDLHPDHYHFYSGPKRPDLVAMLHQDASSARRQELVRIYGETAVSAAWDSITQRFGKGLNEAESRLRREGLKKASEQASEAKTAQEKRESDPREIERAKSRVESLINGVRISNNHALNHETKEYLRGLENSFIKPGQTEPDYFAYEIAVKAYIDAQVSTSVR